MSSGTIRRVEIEGQFDPSNPWVAFRNRQPCRVHREQLTASSDVPSNWNSFCDETDQSLKQLMNPRRTYMITSVIIVIMFTLSIAVSILGRSIYSDLTNGNTMIFYIVPVVVFVIAMASIYTFVKMRAELARIFREVTDICTRYSIPNEVVYTVNEEYWGGCSQYHARRRFLNVNIYNQYDSENQRTTNGQTLMTHNAVETKAESSGNKFNDHPENNNNNGGGASSLFSQLAGEIRK